MRVNIMNKMNSAFYITISSLLTENRRSEMY